MKKTLVILFLIALFFRVYKLDIYPQAIDEDEMALGYYGYSLYKTGTDEYGNKFPIYFESNGDYKYGLYSYFAGIPITLFGLNTVTTRIVAALSGTFMVLVLVVLLKELTGNNKLSLISGVILALNPTHIHFSRVAYNNILGGLFTLLAILYYVKVLKKISLKNSLFTILFFVLSIYSYQAYRVYLPLTLVTIFIVYSLDSPKPVKGKKVTEPWMKHQLKIFFSLKGKLKHLLVLTACLLIVILSSISKESRARSQSLSLLVDVPHITELRTEDYLAGATRLSRLFHNKLTEFATGFLKRYFSYYDPNFLFTEVSQSGERHATPGLGLLYLIDAPFLLIGFICLFRTLGKKECLVILALLFFAPLAASLVNDSRNTTRAVIMVVGYSTLVGVGVYTVLNLLKTKTFIVVLAFLYIMNVLYGVQQYTVQKVYHQPWFSDVGLKEMVTAVDMLLPKYEKVVVSKGHYIPFLFYNKVDPNTIKTVGKILPVRVPGEVRLTELGKILFNMPYDCPFAGKENVLYVCFGYKVPKHAHLVQVIRYKDGFPAILLVEFNGEQTEKLPDRLDYSTDEDVRLKNGILPQSYEGFWPI